MKYTDPDGNFAVNVAAAVGGTIIGGVLGAAAAYAAGGDKKQILTAAAGGAVAGGLAGITLGASTVVQSAVVSATVTGATAAEVDGVVQIAKVGNGQTDAQSFDTRSMAAAGVSGFVSSIISAGVLKLPSVATESGGKLLANIIGSNAGGEVSTLLKNSRNGNPLIQKEQQIRNFVYSTGGAFGTWTLDNPSITTIGKGILQGLKENLADSAIQEYLKELTKNE